MDFPKIFKQKYLKKMKGEPNKMIYSNDDPMALFAMEAERTGNYGSGYYDDDGLYTPRCPVCGAFEPEYFYMNDDEECLGCTECVYKTEDLF